MQTWTSATASSVVLRVAASDCRCCRIVSALCVFSTMPRMQFSITCAACHSNFFLERKFLPGCSSTRPPDDRHPPGQDWASPQAVDGLVQDRDLDGGAGRGVKRLLHCFVQPSRLLEAPALLHPSFSFLLRDPQRSHSPPLLKPPDPRAAQVVPTQCGAWMH